jgi:hypothetical protein
MSDLIRIAPGLVTAYDLLNTDSYLVKNWARTSDMLNTSRVWSASQPEKPLERETVKGLGLGTGAFYGGYSGTFNIFVATPLMRQYLFETVMQSRPVAPVTVYMQASQTAFDDSEFAVLYGEIERVDYTRFNDRLFHTIQFEFRRGEILEPVVLAYADGETPLLLGNGNYLAFGNQG